MIDTDKYEGHYTDDYDMFWVTNSNQLNADTERANATTNLIQDAPQLLAEVRRLREEIKDYDACLQNLWDNEMIPEDTDIWDEVKELLEVEA